MHDKSLFLSFFFNLFIGKKIPYGLYPLHCRPQNSAQKWQQEKERTWTEGLLLYHHNTFPPTPSPFLHCNCNPISKPQSLKPPRSSLASSRTPTLTTCRNSKRVWTISASSPSQPQPLDLTEDNIRLVLVDARVELSQLFDDSVGITGQVELAELDGPFVKIGLKGRFWHKRSTVLARLGNYLKQRIPEILEVDIEDEKQLDDSPANFQLPGDNTCVQDEPEERKSFQSLQAEGICINLLPEAIKSAAVISLAGNLARKMDRLMARSLVRQSWILNVCI